MLWTWMCFRKLWQQPTRTPSLQHSTEEPPSQEIELQMFSSFYLHMEGTRCSCFFHFPHAFSRWWLHCCPAPLTVPETIEAFSQPEMHPLKWTGSLPSAKRINGDLMGSWDRMNWKDRHVRRDYCVGSCHGSDGLPGWNNTGRRLRDWRLRRVVWAALTLGLCGDSWCRAT